MLAKFPMLKFAMFEFPMTKAMFAVFELPMTIAMVTPMVTPLYKMMNPVSSNCSGRTPS